MRTCRNCGQSGHDRRNCPAAVKPKESATSLEPVSTKKEKVTDGIDEETREAIDWYMEKQCPGYLERQKARLLHPEPESSDDPD
jgi:hypothetical protein